MPALSNCLDNLHITFKEEKKEQLKCITICYPSQPFENKQQYTQTQLLNVISPCASEEAEEAEGTHLHINH